MDALKKMYGLIEERAPYALQNARTKDIVPDAVKCRTSRSLLALLPDSAWYFTATVWITFVAMVTHCASSRRTTGSSAPAKKSPTTKPYAPPNIQRYLRVFVVVGDLPLPHIYLS